MIKERLVHFVNEVNWTQEKGFNVCVIKETNGDVQPNYHQTTKFIDDTIEQAELFCDEQNQAQGISKAEAETFKMLSMFPNGNREKILKSMLERFPE